MGCMCVVPLRAERVVEQVRAEKAAGYDRMIALIQFVDDVIQRPSAYVNDEHKLVNSIRANVEAIVLAITPGIKPRDKVERVGRLASVVHRFLAKVLGY
jgi:hypothetical protein